MPVKIRKPRKRKASKRTASRQVKDEKARYERCRRRRWGLVKKAREYSALFGAEVYLLVKDEHNAHYFTSKDPWISAPQDVGAVRVEAPGRKIHQPQEDQEDQSISGTSSDEPLDARSEGSADATSEGPLCATSPGRDLQCGYVGFVTRLEKVYRALGTLRHPDNDDDADFGRESSPEGRG